jgi:hypothetical protein
LIAGRIRHGGVTLNHAFQPSAAPLTTSVVSSSGTSSVPWSITLAPLPVDDILQQSVHVWINHNWYVIGRSTMIRWNYYTRQWYMVSRNLSREPMARHDEPTSVIALPDQSLLLTFRSIRPCVFVRYRSPSLRSDGRICIQPGAWSTLHWLEPPPQLIGFQCIRLHDHILTLFGGTRNDSPNGLMCSMV